ncbi:MAG: DNA repair protein RecN [Candidatus Microthrix parvicella]|jgi:DNA repair protein RecN (Recombination protein N)
MLDELAVTDLGVIAKARLELRGHMTALTGETGAGKTLLLGALELLSGARADASVVRAGAEQAVVEGRFINGDGDELVLRRVVPRDGRSRAYCNGSLVTAAELAEAAAGLLEIHSQGAQLALTTPGVQRQALDRWANVDLSELTAAESAVGSLRAALVELGGDERARVREMDLLAFQVAEIGSAGLSDPDEDAALAAEEALLADAVGHREAASKALGVYDEEGGLSDALAAMAGALDDRRPFDGTLTRVLAQQAELSDLVAELRRQADSIEEDPERLEVVRLRRVELRDLGRKYGDTLAEVMAFGQECQVRLDELGDRERRAAALEDDLAAACLVRDEAAAKVGAARRSAAPQLATSVQARLAALAMPKATLEITVGDDDPGDRVTFLLAANPGMAPAPIQRAASGGELSRVLLALRLVLSGGPDTMVFDEVDAGIGGATALEVGSALSEVAETSQVLVVTHLAQVAAHADQQVRIAKSADEDATTTTVESVGGEARVVELSRMLSGTPDSAAARSNAKDLLERVPRRAPDPSTAGPTR